MMDYLPLAMEYKKLFKQDPEDFLKTIGKFPSIRGVLVQLYYQLVKGGKCERIEDLPDTEKRELLAEAKRIAAVQETNYLIEVCKALQGFGAFIQI